LREKRGNHELCQIVGSLKVNIVGDGQPVSALGSNGGGNVSLEIILSLLDEVWVVQEVVFSIEIKIDNVVAQSSQVSLTT
jgi:hypothetical protein